MSTRDPSGQPPIGVNPALFMDEYRQWAFCVPPYTADVRTTERVRSSPLVSTDQGPRAAPTRTQECLSAPRNEHHQPRSVHISPLQMVRHREITSRAETAVRMGSAHFATVRVLTAGVEPLAEVRLPSPAAVGGCSVIGLKLWLPSLLGCPAGSVLVCRAPVTCGGGGLRKCAITSSSVSCPVGRLPSGLFPPLASPPSPPSRVPVHWYRRDAAARHLRKRRPSQSSVNRQLYG